MTEPTHKAVSIRVPIEDYKWIQHLAKLEDRSITNMIIRIIRLELPVDMEKATQE